MLFALLSAGAASLVFYGGALYERGQLVAGIAVTALGAGWLGILYSALLRMAGAR